MLRRKGRGIVMPTPMATAFGIPEGHSLADLARTLLALGHEWRTRRDIERSLGHLSNLHLHDVA